jgi:4-hydroxy-3-methylbut-2-enyl diphosphate reductase
VRFAHRAVARLVREGFHPVIIGKRDHVEVRGITEDLAEYDVVLTPEDVARMTERPRFGVAAQTTQPIDKVHCLAALMCERFPRAEVRLIDTVCQPTKQRQRAAIQLAQQCEVIVVVGGAHSNNTKELAATCGRFGARVHHVQTAAELRREWFTGAAVVGITAGTSTPDEVIEGVARRLEEFAGGAVPAPEPVFDLQAV